MAGTTRLELATSAVTAIDIKRCRRTSFDTTRYRMSLLIVPLLYPDLILRISIKICSFFVSTDCAAGPSAGKEVDRETELFQLATEIRRISLTPVT
jgi:hypothetical protein